MTLREGVTAAEALVVLTIVGLAAAVALPASHVLRTHGRVAAGARELGLRVQAMRWRAVATNRTHGLWFVDRDGEWCWFEVRDGNGNGLRLAELRNGVDERLSGPHRLGERLGGVRIGLPGGIRIRRIPPADGWLPADGDPIRFGPSDIVACSPLGTASSGTIYLGDGKRALRAIVVFGPTARVRIWRYEVAREQWRR